MNTTRTFGRIALVGFGVQVPTLVALHLLRTDYDPTANFVSGYANGPYAWMLHVGQVGSFVGTLALMVALRSAGLATGSSVALVCLVISVAMKPVGFLFPMDSVKTAFDAAGSPQFSTSGWIHAISGMIGAVSMMIAIVIITIRLLRSHQIRGGFWTMVGLSVIAPVFYVATTTTRPGAFPSGLYQRSFIACLLLWLIVTSYGLTSGAFTAARRNGR